MVGRGVVVNCGVSVAVGVAVGMGVLVCAKTETAGSGSGSSLPAIQPHAVVVNNPMVLII